MPHTFSDDQVRRLRVRAQRLSDNHAPAPDIAAVLKQVVGVQAQDARSAALSVRARSPGVTAAEIEDARVETRSVIRTWLMRGTLHLAASEDLGWLLPLLGPRFMKTSRRRRAALGLDEETTARGVRALEKALAHYGPLTRSEIRDALAPEAIPLEGQAAPHLIRHAALEGILCYSSDWNGRPTYTLLDDGLDSGPPLPEEEALARLARRYLRAYGPAGVKDLARWSGLTMRRARKGWKHIEDERIEVVTDRGPAWMLAADAERLGEPPSRPPVRLLPKFDTYLLGYRNRDLVLPPPYAKRIYPGGGMLRRSVLVDGRVLGTWNPEKKGDDALHVVVEPFEPLPPHVHAGLEAEAKDVARFMGREGTLEVEPAGAWRSGRSLTRKPPSPAACGPWLRRRE